MPLRSLAILLAALLVSMQVLAQSGAPAGCRTTIKAHGGRGDGIADDTAAIVRALGSSCAVSGEKLTYRLTRSVELPDNVNLSDGTFLQDIPANGLLRAFRKSGGKNVVMTSIRINRGNNPRLGTIEDAAAIWIAKTTNVVLTDVEVFGDGLGTGILIAESSQVKLIRPYVHDMRWEAATQPENEVMVGIWTIRSTDVTIEAPRIADLTPVAIQAIGGRAAGRRNNMTDGLASSGTQGLVVVNPEISNVGEGIDVSGSHVTRDFTITGGNIHDIDSFCYKWTNVQGPGVVQNSVAARCGLGGYVAAGAVTGVQFIDNVALDIGSNRKWLGSETTGFSLRMANGVMPSNITIKDSRAIDEQPSRTMRIGFRSDQVVPTNRLVNATTSGYLNAPVANFPK